LALSVFWRRRIDCRHFYVLVVVNELDRLFQIQDARRRQADASSAVDARKTIPDDVAFY